MLVVAVTAFCRLVEARVARPLRSSIIDAVDDQVRLHSVPPFFSVSL